MADRSEYYRKWKKTKSGKAATKRAWTKYNHSKKKSSAQSRYYQKHKEKIYSYQKEWRKRNKDKVVGYQESYYSKNRHKRIAKDAVNNAFKDGRMTKMPCAVCGEFKVEGHHPDYTKKLHVIWLCHKHHTEVHKRPV